MSNNTNNANIVNDNNAISRAIAELQEIKSRSEETDRRLSAAFYKSVLLYLRYEKEPLLQAVLATCERLRIAHVKETVTWSTSNELVFQQVETLTIPIINNKETALYAFVGHKKSGKSLFSLIQEYLAYRKTTREDARKKALAALKRADLVSVMQATEKSLKATAKKFPQHERFFAYMSEALNKYRE